MLLIAAAGPAAAGQEGWATQAVGFQTNGAVTVKSLAGGSYAGTQNPSGAVAKSSQTAVTQAPTVVIQATGTSAQFVTTNNLYTGNLGGRAGGDAKCSSELGAGWKFASFGKLIAITPGASLTAWIDADARFGLCANWSDSSSAQSGRQLTVMTPMNGTGALLWNLSTVSCNTPLPLTCTTL